MRTQLGLIEYSICFLINAKSILSNYKKYQKSRRDLLKLNSDQLKDIGITEEEAKKEANKPFWEGRESEFISNNHPRSRYLGTEAIEVKF